MDPDGSMERALAAAGYAPIAGADEVGRGALAGPLYACAVILPPDAAIEGLRDSKLLTPAARRRIAAVVRARAIAWCMVRVRPTTIDKRGLHRSNLWALRQAVVRLQPRPGYVLTDGFRPKRLPVPALSIKKGDRISASVAAASVLAKVARDAAMVRLARRYPGYGFERNVGYGTPEHLEALRQLGPSPVHRRSFDWSTATS